MYTEEQLSNASFMFVSCINNSSNPTNLERCQIKIQHYPVFSQFGAASYFEADSLVHFEAHGLKYGTMHTFKISQLINYNSVFFDGNSYLTGSDIYVHSFESNLNKLNISFENLKLESKSLDKNLDIDEAEYLNLKRKKAFLMTLQGQVVEITSLKNAPDDFSRAAKSTHWKVINSTCFDSNERVLSEFYCDYSNDIIHQITLDLYGEQMKK